MVPEVRRNDDRPRTFDLDSSDPAEPAEGPGVLVNQGPGPHGISSRSSNTATRTATRVHGRRGGQLRRTCRVGTRSRSSTATAGRSPRPVTAGSTSDGTKVASRTGSRGIPRGQRLAGAVPVADLRHHLPGPEVRRRRHEDRKREIGAGGPQRPRDPRGCGADRSTSWGYPGEVAVGPLRLQGGSRTGRLSEHPHSSVGFPIDSGSAPAASAPRRSGAGHPRSRRCRR